MRPMQNVESPTHQLACAAHDFNTDHSILTTFQTLPGASFVTNAASRPATLRWLPPKSNG
jgi:hypothetical protein